MTMDEKPQKSAGQSGYQGAELGTGLIDVLMRGLEMAKRNMENEDPTTTREFCALLYGTPGTLCPLGYWHRPDQ
jgi:hypothetical protein